MLLKCKGNGTGSLLAACSLLLQLFSLLLVICPSFIVSNFQLNPGSV